MLAAAVVTALAPWEIASAPYNQHGDVKLVL